MLAQLDRLPGVEHSYGNRTGDMVRMSLVTTAAREEVAKQALKVLGASRSPICLTGTNLIQTLEHEQWRQSDRVGELLQIEYRTLAQRELRPPVLRVMEP